MIVSPFGFSDLLGSTNVAREPSRIARKLDQMPVVVSVDMNG